eukprot:s2508_g4.t1
MGVTEALGELDTSDCASAPEALSQSRSPQETWDDPCRASVPRRIQLRFFQLKGKAHRCLLEAVHAQESASRGHVAGRLMASAGPSCSSAEISGEARPETMTGCDREREVLTELDPQGAVRGQAHHALVTSTDGLVFFARV